MDGDDAARMTPEVDRPNEVIEVRERVRLNERERIVLLRVEVDADNVKSGQVVSHCSAASAAEQVEKEGPSGWGRHRRDPTTSSRCAVRPARARGSARRRIRPTAR